MNDKIYWTDINERRIGVMDLLNRNNYKYDLLSAGENSSPRGIAVDPTTRYMYNDICACAFVKLKEKEKGMTVSKRIIIIYEQQERSLFSSAI